MRTIEERNRMIAEFMGVIKYRPFGDYIEINGDAYEFEDIKYHTSWDWLMPVVENIDHYEYESALIDKIDIAIKTRCIDDVYKAVVEFIEMYNEQN